MPTNLDFYFAWCGRKKKAYQCATSHKLKEQIADESIIESIKNQNSKIYFCLLDYSNKVKTNIHRGFTNMRNVAYQKCVNHWSWQLLTIKYHLLIVLMMSRPMTSQYKSTLLFPLLLMIEIIPSTLILKGQ